VSANLSGLHVLASARHVVAAHTTLAQHHTMRPIDRPVSNGPTVVQPSWCDPVTWLDHLH
jgi:hypothetical protein